MGQHQTRIEPGLESTFRCAVRCDDRRIYDDGDNNVVRCRTDCGLRLVRKTFNGGGERLVRGLPPHQNVASVYAIANGYAYLEELHHRRCWTAFDRQRRQQHALEGLRHLHSNGLAHNDVGHDNVMWRKSDDTFVLIDFETVSTASPIDVAKDLEWLTRFV
jgi:hypothetical protein